MFISFHVMQPEDIAVSRGQQGDGALNHDPINDRRLLWTLGGKRRLRWESPFFEGLFGPYPTLAPVHQYLIDGETVQPGREGPLTAKRSDFSPQIHKDVLPEVLGFGRVGHHAQAECIDSLIVPTV